MKFTQKTCVITDSIDPDIYPDESLYVLWNSFSTSSSSSTISIPSYVDDNSTTLRKDYHQLLSNLADYPVFSNVKLSSFFSWRLVIVISFHLKYLNHPTEISSSS